LQSRSGIALRGCELHRDGPCWRFRRVRRRPRMPQLPASSRATGVLPALVEPFAVGLHGVHSAEISPGDDVLIVGAGGVGLTTLVWALQKGGVRVTVADPDPRRRDAARAIGATDVLASVSEAEPRAYDAVLECVGRPELVQACQPTLRPRGRLVVSGACAEPTSIEPITALLKELTVRYSVAYTADEFRTVITSFGNGDIDPSPTLGPNFGLADVAKAFDAVRETRVQRRVSVRP
jgi:(R,R)-butanediol dehydrogenase / meso-butanediol dehydrogenase / diacetyl reductase